MEVLAKEEGRKEVEWPRMFSHLVNLMGLVQHEQNLEEIWDDYSDQDNYKWDILLAVFARVEHIYNVFSFLFYLRE